MKHVKKTHLCSNNFNYVLTKTIIIVYFKDFNYYFIRVTYC